MMSCPLACRYLTEQDEAYVPLEGSGATAFPSVPAIVNPKAGSLISFSAELPHGALPMWASAEKRLAVIFDVYKP